MSNEITTAYVKQYAGGVRLLQQQMDSRLRSGVLVDNSVVGDRSFYDQVDAVSMQEIKNRHGDTEYVETPHKRRMVTMTPYEVADLVDRVDQRRLLNDPVNPYSRSQAAAVNRQLDDIIIEAFDAIASTGVDGAGKVPFPGGEFSRPSQPTLTVADLTQARSVLESQENMEDDGDYRWYAVMTAVAREKLLAQEEVTSSDYNTIRALVNGQIDQYLGFDFVKSQRLPLNGDDRSLFFWVKSSMRLAIAQDGTAFMDRLPQKRHSIQVRYEVDAGATRMDEKGVYRIILDEVN